MGYNIKDELKVYADYNKFGRADIIGLDLSNKVFEKLKGRGEYVTLLACGDNKFALVNEKLMPGFLP